MPILYQSKASSLLRKSALVLIVNYAILALVLLIFAVESSTQITGLMWLINCSLAYGALIKRSSGLYYLSSIGLVALIAISLTLHIEYLSTVSVCFVIGSFLALCVVLFNIQTQLFKEIS